MISKRSVKLVALLVVLAANSQLVMAADANGKAGIKAADDQVRGYFGAGTSLMYAIGALVALIGAVKVYQKWSGGEPDTAKVAASWFGACIFLVVVATIISSFFGV